jgi:hypothetical protein
VTFANTGPAQHHVTSPPSITVFRSWSCDRAATNRETGGGA